MTAEIVEACNALAAELLARDGPPGANAELVALAWGMLLGVEVGFLLAIALQWKHITRLSDTLLRSGTAGK